MIRITTLGGFVVQKDGPAADVVTQNHGKRNALLAYLAAEQSSGSHARETLLALFRPESDDKRARDALKQLVRSLRRDLGNDVVLPSRGSGVELNPSAVWCDAAALEAAAEAGNHERVLELYRGEFLAGFHLTGSHPFEEWLTRKHLRLLDTAVSAARALADGHDAAGNTESAIAMARRVVGLRPFDESGLRALIQLYLQAGEPGQAVEAFDVYSERLERELGASPSEETVDLVERARTPVVVRRDPAAVTIEAPRREVMKQDRAAPAALAPPRKFRPRAVALAGAITLTVAGGLALRGLPRPEPPALDTNRVLVEVLENLTGDRRLDYSGRQAADRIAAGLASLEFLDVQPSEGKANPDPSAGAGTLVRGSIFASGNDLRLDATLVDAGSRRTVAPIPSVHTKRDDLLQGFDRLTDQVMAAAGAYTDPRVAPWLVNASWPRTLEAYRLFAEGLGIHTTVGRYAHTKGLFLAAYQADTTFTMAALWAGLAAENASERSFADSLYAALRSRRSEMPRVDAHFLEYLAAAGPLSQLRELRQLVQHAPESNYIGLAAGAAFRSQRPEEALTYFTRAGAWEGNIAADALEALGRCEEILPVAARSEALAKSVWDSQIAPSSMRLLAYACMGDAERFLAAMREHVARLASARLTGSRQRGELAFHVQGLIAHLDDPSAADPAVDYVAGLLTERLHEDPQVVAVLAELLASAGRTEAAERVLREATSLDRERVYWREPWLLAMLEAGNDHNERIERLLSDTMDRWRRQAGEGRDVCNLCAGVVRAHQGDLEDALAHLTKVDFTGWEWWQAHHRPFVYGPLRGHPVFERLIAPQG